MSTYTHQSWQVQPLYLRIAGNGKLVPSFSDTSILISKQIQTTSLLCDDLYF